MIVGVDEFLAIRNTTGYYRQLKVENHAGVKYGAAANMFLICTSLIRSRLLSKSLVYMTSNAFPFPNSITVCSVGWGDLLRGIRPRDAGRSDLRGSYVSDFALASEHGVPGSVHRLTTKDVTLSLYQRSVDGQAHCVHAQGFNFSISDKYDSQKRGRLSMMLEVSEVVIDFDMSIALPAILPLTPAAYKTVVISCR
jgi:hypothetical protein